MRTRHSAKALSCSSTVPTPQLAAVADELHAAVAENVGESEQRYPWRMIRNHLKACQAYVSSAEVLIRPLIPPTWDHAPFAGATQRIFMSATLGAGGYLERLTGRPKIMRLPIQKVGPVKASDVGSSSSRRKR